jgi:uncharacterized protein (TIGR00255 family)
MRWVNGGHGAGSLQLNVDRAREAMARLRELQTAVGISGDISLDLLARQMDVLTVGDGETAAISWDDVEPIVGHAATACRAMRRREGDALALELSQRLSELARLARDIESRAPERMVQERDRLRASVAELLDGRTVDELRLHQELAFLAEKLDITEELVRLKAHFAATEQALGRSGGVGKQLGFLVQEMGREINTIGSKAGDATIAQAVIAMKGELEKFREQVENLE